MQTNQKDRAVRSSERKLFRSTAARCRGNCLVLEREDSGLAAEIRRRGLRVKLVQLGPFGGMELESAIDGLQLPEDGFRTVVVMGVLDHLSEEATAMLLGVLWNALPTGGRLVVTVNHRQAGRSLHRRQEFDRRRFRKLLSATTRPLARPRLAADQPFSWLTMYADKKRRRAKKGLSRVIRDRYRETARLCLGSVIELGCGRGDLAAVIRDRGLSVLGVDISAAEIRAARETHADIEFIHSDIRKLDLPAASFDTAVIAEVLEHVPASVGSEMLEAAWRLLRRGGRLIVSVPNEDLVPHRNHVREFSRRSLRQLLQTFGMPRTVTRQPLKWLMLYVDKR